MAGIYFERTLEPVLKRAFREFPAVALTGPRQSGKTTLLKHLFGKRAGYVSLEAPDVLASAVSDPRGFLEAHPAPLILDEIQHAPGLLPYLKERIDARREKTGQYLLTGSQNLLLHKGVTETLAGRVAILKLLPFSRAETAHRPEARLPWEIPKSSRPLPPESRRGFWPDILRGNYPEPVAHPRRDYRLWQSSYLQTYLERDVRDLRQIGDLVSFQLFLQALAARSGTLLSLSGLSRDLGVAVNTVKNWISILEATYQVLILRPYFANVGKRLVKTPKLYFTDTGTLCHLVGLQDAEHAAKGPMAGALFETAVVAEVYKTILHRGEIPRIYFWRTAAGAEVDLVLAQNGKLVPVEIKLSATPKPAMAAGIRDFQNTFAGEAGKGYLIHAGTGELPLAPGVAAFPFARL